MTALQGDAPGRRVIRGVRQALLYRQVRLRIRAGNQHTVALSGESFRNRGDLLRRLALAQHDLRVPRAERAVVVQRGVSEVLVGQVAQPVQRFIHGDGALLERFQQLFQA